MNKPWLFLGNPFLTATRNSFERALTISTYTDAALMNDPSKTALYDVYHPLHVALVDAFSTWKHRNGTQAGNTNTFKRLLAGVTDALNDWDFELQRMYRKDTPQYLSFFPDGHAPFITGKQDTRIAAIKTLGMAMNEDAQLMPLASRVNNYYNSISDAIKKQKSAISATKGGSTDIEAARVAACIGLYAVLGGLMNMLAETPADIARYFNLELVRKTQQTTFTGHVEAGKNTVIAKRTLQPEDEVTLRNTGLITLSFYLSGSKGLMAIPSGAAQVAPGETVTTPASTLGDVNIHHILVVAGEGPAGEGAWEVEL